MINHADLSTRQGIQQTIAQLAAVGCRVGVPTILRNGVLSGRCGIGILGLRSAAFPAAELGRARNPTILIVGDDDDAASGPLAWRNAHRLARWPNAVLVHAAGAEERHYLLAIAKAEEVGRVLLIETSSNHAWRWARFLAHPQTLIIAPPNGLPHPLPRSTGSLH